MSEEVNEQKEIKFNWKYHLKASFKDFLEGLIDILGMISVFVLIISNMTNPQLHVLQQVFESELYPVVGLLFIGIVVTGCILSTIVQAIATLLFYLFKYMFGK